MAHGPVAATAAASTTNESEGQPVLREVTAQENQPRIYQFEAFTRF